MSVKDFKFVSPGVFINEIDNSFIPKSTDVQIGPVVVGRATRGLAMQPVTVQSYSEFVRMFGDTVGGASGNDAWREGTSNSPMYGTYAAKAFLRSNVAPLTFLRLLGQESPTQDGTTPAQAGWKTPNTPNRAPASNGGSYGLFLFPSASAVAADLGTGSLAAIFYVDNGDLFLSGTIYGGSGSWPGSKAAAPGVGITGSNGTVLGQDGDNLWNVVVSGNVNGEEKISFTFDDTSANFIRNKFNTSPTNVTTPRDFYPSASHKSYWLGQSFEQRLQDRQLIGANKAVGVVFALSKGTATGPWNMLGQASREARSGWFIGQALDAANTYVPSKAQKLFRLIGRGHGEWLQKNVKISIENVRYSNSNTNAYGTFSVVLRALNDSDANVLVMERYDNCNLDPSSPNYLARKIGDKFTQWDNTERSLKEYGDYDNQSKFVYVEMNDDVDAAACDASLLPFGYYGPPQFQNIMNLQGTGSFTTASYPGEIAPIGVDVDDPLRNYSPEIALSSFYVTGASGIPHGAGGTTAGATTVGGQVYLSGGCGIGGGVTALRASCTGSLEFPHVRLRTSASAGGLSNYQDAYYGMMTTRTSGSSASDASISDFHRLLFSGYDAGGGDAGVHSTAGVANWSYIFSLDDVVLKSGTSTSFYYSSGSRTREDSYTSASYKSLLDAGVNRFTAPLWGGFDGFDITKPDPLYNNGMTNISNVDEDKSAAYYTWKRGLDTVADPEFINMNLLATPGLTQKDLTGHAINICEERGDAMALIDLPDVYIPPHEKWYASKTSRLGSTPENAVNRLRDRFIDSSYGATFYPWVQTRDENTARTLWVPPSVAMMGVLASSERASELWFAPAGFNRGGLSEGAAGIPVTNVLTRLTAKQRDTLYDANINPIASFPSTGIVVFGQKTLQTRRSALDRINVRRLVIFLKKQISILSTRVLFDQNVSATWDRFKGLIEPFLNDVKTRLGIVEYRLILDETTTTPDLIDQNIMYAKIMVKPARAIEYIAIDFVIASTGASFDD